MEEDKHGNDNNDAGVAETASEETQIVVSASNEDDGSHYSHTLSPSDSAEDDPILEEQKQRLRLVCPKHEEQIHIDNLEQWKYNNHHRAIVHLLVCLAGSEIWCTDKTSTEGREDRMVKAYKE